MSGRFETYIQDLGRGQGWSLERDRAQSVPGMSAVLRRWYLLRLLAKVLLGAIAKSRAGGYPRTRPLVRPIRSPACSLILDAVHTPTP